MKNKKDKILYFIATDKNNLLCDEKENKLLYIIKKYILILKGYKNKKKVGL